METDVVIVGAGPSGAAAAYRLGKSGLSVTVVERLNEEQFARYHRICGAAVSRRNTRFLDIRDGEVLNQAEHIRIAFPGGHEVFSEIDGIVIDRPKLLSRLHKASAEMGVSFIDGCVTDVFQDSVGCTAVLKDGTEIKSRYIIGADGAYSVVRKKIFGTEPEIMLRVEEFHSHNKAEEGTLRFSVEERKAHFYQWCFPYGGGRCTGAVFGYCDPEPDGEKGVRVIPMGSVPEIVKGNVLLTGDAAGMPNPVTAGGLRTAFLSGYQAAEAVIGGNPRRYQRWWSYSKMSDRRFMDLHKTLSSFDDAQLERFAEHFVHKGIWLNGIASVLRRPGDIRLYLGCLMCLKYGW